MGDFDGNRSDGGFRGGPFAPPRTVSIDHIVFDNALELGGYVVALERDGLLTVHIDWRNGTFPGSRQTDSNIGLAGFSRTVHHTAHDGNVHLLNARKLGRPGRHPVAQILLNLGGQRLKIRTRRTAATRAGNHRRGKGAQSEALQDLLGHEDFLRPVATRFRCERDPDGVADTLLQ